MSVPKIPDHVCRSQQAPLRLSADDPRLIERREFLWRFGGGLGGIALTHLLGHGGLLADATPKESADLERRAASSGKGKTRGSALHVRRGEPVRHVRLQASVD